LAGLGERAVSILDLRWGRRKPKPPDAQTLPDPPASPARRTPIRVTDEGDGQLLNRTYSYWSNAYIGPGGLVTLFVGHADGRPKFFRVNLATGAVERLGALLGYGGTGEGWYWDREGYIFLCDGPRLRRVNPFTGHDTVVLDISQIHPGYRLWQAHSSDDGVTHSATVEKVVSEGAYPRLGTVVSRRGEVMLFSAVGALDESHISADGNWLIIEEDNDNRIIDLVTKDERRLTNAEGALSHLDSGHGFIVGEDDQRGACTYLDVKTLERRVLFETWNQGVVSVKGGKCLVTDSERLKLVALDGSGVIPLEPHGMTGGDYDRTCRANLDPTGAVAMYVSNATGRMDAYILPVA
jgi:hypothetical protein